MIGLVELNKQRRIHIIQRHPIMEDYLKHLRIVLEQPKEIRTSNKSEDVLLFYGYFDNIEDGKYVVAVVNKSMKEVLTAYLSHRIKIGRNYEKN